MKKEMGYHHIVILALGIIILLAGCTTPNYEAKYKRLICIMGLEEWDISSVTNGDLMIWLERDGGKEILYGTKIDNETNGVLYMGRDSGHDLLKIIHIADQRASTAMHPYPFSPSHRVYKVKVWNNESKLIASSYDGDIKIFCRLTSSSLKK